MNVLEYLECDEYENEECEDLLGDDLRVAEENQDEIEQVLEKYPGRELLLQVVVLLEVDGGVDVDLDNGDDGLGQEAEGREGNGDPRVHTLEADILLASLDLVVRVSRDVPTADDGSWDNIALENKHDPFIDGEIVQQKSNGLIIFLELIVSDIRGGFRKPSFNLHEKKKKLKIYIFFFFIRNKNPLRRI